MSHHWRVLAEDDRLWRQLHNQRLAGPLVMQYGRNPLKKEIEKRKKERDSIRRQVCCFALITCTTHHLLGAVSQTGEKETETDVARKKESVGATR